MATGVIYAPAAAASDDASALGGRMSVADGISSRVLNYFLSINHFKRQ